jgi:hypothetical protein
LEKVHCSGSSAFRCRSSFSSHCSGADGMLRLRALRLARAGRRGPVRAGPFLWQLAVPVAHLSGRSDVHDAASLGVPVVPRRAEGFQIPGRVNGRHHEPLASGPRHQPASGSNTGGSVRHHRVVCRNRSQGGGRIDDCRQGKGCLYHSLPAHASHRSTRAERRGKKSPCAARDTPLVGKTER